MLSLDDETQDNEAPSTLSASNPEQRTEHLQCLNRIEQALQELPELQREACSLHRFDRLTSNKIRPEIEYFPRPGQPIFNICRTVAYCRLRMDYSVEHALSMLSSKETDDE